MKSQILKTRNIAFLYHFRNKNGSDENVNLYSYYGDLEGSLPKSIKNDSYQANNTNYRQNSKLIEHNEISNY